MQSAVENAPSNAVWNELSPLLDEAMSRLGPADRDALVLRYFENKSLQELGAELGVEERAAQKRVARGLEKLRAFFARRGVALSAAAIAGAVSASSVQAAPAHLASTITAVAIANGAAAGSSTLTLVKGTLKLMAWTKAKIAIVVGVSALLAAGTTGVIVKKSTPSNPSAIYEEIWRRPDGSSYDKLDAAPPALIIRPTHYPQGGSGFWTTSGKGVFVNASVSDLACWAYGFGPARMVFPNEPRERYDYLNTLSNEQNQANHGLGEKIKEQFGFTARREIRKTNVLALRILDSARLSSHLTQGKSPSNYGTGDNNVQKRILTNQKLEAITRLLEGTLEKPVIDQTGVSTHYDITFQWTEKNWKSHQERMAAIQQALLDQLDQLGLELVPSREPIEMLIVERAD